MPAVATVRPVDVVARAAAHGAVAAVAPIEAVGRLQAPTIAGHAQAASPGRYPWLHDSFGFGIDTLVFERAFEPSFESVSMGDAIASWDIGKALDDDFDMTEAVSRFTFDTLVMLDTALVALEHVRSLVDSFTVADADPLIGGTSDIFAADVVTMLESAVTAVETIVSDGASITDVLTKELGRLAADAATLSDATVADFSKAVADTITLTEAIVRDLSTVRSDSATPTDAGNWFKQDYVDGDYFAADFVGSTGSI